VVIIKALSIVIDCNYSSQNRSLRINSVIRESLASQAFFKAILKALAARIVNLDFAPRVAGGFSAGLKMTRRFRVRARR